MTFKVEIIQLHSGYTVVCPELPGCVTEGDTEEEALNNVRGAIVDYLSVAPTVPLQKKTMFVEVGDSLLAQEREAPLATAGPTRSVARKSFKVVPWDMGLPKQWTSGKVSDLLEILDSAESLDHA